MLSTGDPGDPHKFYIVRGLRGQVGGGGGKGQSQQLAVILTFKCQNWLLNSLETISVLEG